MLHRVGEVLHRVGEVANGRVQQRRCGAESGVGIVGCSAAVARQGEIAKGVGAVLRGAVLERFCPAESCVGCVGHRLAWLCYGCAQKRTGETKYRRAEAKLSSVRRWCSYALSCHGTVSPEEASAGFGLA